MPAPTNRRVRRRPPAHWSAGADRWFFLSYGRTPPARGEGRAEPDIPVLRFYRDLCAEVRDLANLSPDASVGFCDLEIGRDQHWRDRVTRELAACRVLVPLYSARYIRSDSCGRELSIFLARARAGARPPPIVPVLWSPETSPWPEVLPAPEPLPDADADERYAATGAYQLLELRAGGDDGARDYATLVRAVSTRIVSLAASAPPRPRRPVDLTDVPNAFAQPTVRPLGIHVLAPTTSRLPPGRSAHQYGPSGLDWHPFRDDGTGTLAQHLTEVARNLGYRPTVTSFEDDTGALLGPGRPAGPGVLVLDPWALDDPAWRAQAAQFDRSERPWIGVVVAWNLHDAETTRERERLLRQVDETLERRFRRRRVTLLLDAGVAPSLPDAGRAMAAVVHDVAVQYLRYAPAPAASPIPPDPDPPGGRR